MVAQQAHDQETTEQVLQDYEAGKRALLNGELTTAMSAFDAALVVDPKFAKAHDGRGVALALL
jgi:Flp pilus assembly protein TadD